MANEVLRLKFGDDIPPNEKENIIKKFNLTSHVICICLNRSQEDFIPEWEEISAVAMSVQNMWLTCSANNLGCYWSSPKIISMLDLFFNQWDHGVTGIRELNNTSVKAFRSMF